MRCAARAQLLMNDPSLASVLASGSIKPRPFGEAPSANGLEPWRRPPFVER